MQARFLGLMVAMFCLPCFAAAPAPSVIFSGALKEVPGTKLIVVSLKLEPAGKSPPHPHHHPGSVYVYVTRGVARLGLKGQPVRIVHAGESFFEAPGSVHTVGESASSTQPAYAIAVMLVPDGAPLVTPEAAEVHGDSSK
jgi:quercetin dioxygenase-like cupin family protein